jgi:putative DNA primase/helicase
MSITGYSIGQFVTRFFPSAKKQGSAYYAPCPAHHGEGDSLKIWSERGAVYVKCYSRGCDYRDILTAAGFDLKQETSGSTHKPTFYYTNENGEVIYRTIRHDNPDGSKYFTYERADLANPGKFIKKLGDVKRVLYRWPAVVDAVSRNVLILIVEGEKCVHTAEQLGYVATTNAGGSGSWSKEFGAIFKGASVAILPDHDEPGEKHFKAVSKSLRGYAASIVRVDLPGLEESGDIADWVEAGGTREKLDALIAEAKTAAPESGDNKKRLQVTQLSTVRPVRTEFLWKPFIPRGRPVTLEGDPGVGKSALICKIISHLSTGKAFPNVLPGTPALSDFDPVNVCLLTSEDDSGDTIRPRLEVNGADCSRVYRLEGWQTPDGEHGSITMQDLDLLRMAMNDYKPAMIVFDPFQAYFGKDVDMNRANQTRPVLDAVDNLCRAHNCTPLFIRHVGKSHREAIYAGLGSIDIAGVMRSILFLGQDTENETRRILAHAKMNGGRIGQSLAYKMVSVEYDITTDDGFITVEAPMLKWDGLSSLKANDLSMPIASEAYEERGVVDQAADFLRELLSDGAVLATEAKKEYESAGFTKATMRRAQAKLKVVTRRQAPPSGEWPEDGNKKAPWEWALPPGAQTSPPGAHGYERAEREHLVDHEHVGNKSMTYSDAPVEHLVDHEHVGNKSMAYSASPHVQQKELDDNMIKNQSFIKDSPGAQGSLPGAQPNQNHEHVVTSQQNQPLTWNFKFLREGHEHVVTAQQNQPLTGENSPDLPGAQMRVKDDEHLVGIDDTDDIDFMISDPDYARPVQKRTY